jgi:hypothetical protein
MAALDCHTLARQDASGKEQADAAPRVLCNSAQARHIKLFARPGEFTPPADIRWLTRPAAERTVLTFFRSYERTGLGRIRTAFGMTVIGCVSSARFVEYSERRRGVVERVAQRISRYDQHLRTKSIGAPAAGLWRPRPALRSVAREGTQPHHNAHVGRRTDHPL